MKKNRYLRFCAVAALVAGAVAAADWHVDSVAGKDAADGTTPATAWRTLWRVNQAKPAPGDRVLFKRGGLWRGELSPVSGAPGKPVTYSWYGQGPKPIIQNSADRSKASDWFEESPGLWSTHSAKLKYDVGIFICDHGRRWGVKKWRNPEWKVQELENPLDYWYDPDKKRVLVRFDCNPATAFSSIELAYTRNVVNQNDRHDIVYDGLCVRYAAAHGFGGGSTRNITIRNCDICWIGGGLQFWRRDPKTGKIVYPVRFGNGIEFWGDATGHLVERNRLWEIYDAALTNQGRNNTETDIVWRDNVIWNAEYSFEYWNAKLTANITFEHNTCVDAGYGWAHAQRPYRNGAHLMYFSNRAATTNFVVRNNIFCRATEWTARSALDWRYGLTHDHNLVWNDGEVPVFGWLDGKSLQKIDWTAYRALGFDPHGTFARPTFVNERQRDYRLAPGSVGKGTASDGSDVGARDMPGLDIDQSLRLGYNNHTL